MYGRGTLGALAAALVFASPAAARPGIVGGSAAPAGSWPSTVFLYGTFQDQPYGCTGSVVAPEWIVTAAHCAFGAPGRFAESMTAILSAKDYTDRATREVIGVDRLVVHPAYDPARDLHDVAVFHLSRPTTAPAIRLATSDEHAAHRYISYVDEPNAAGWGRTDARSTVDTTVLQQAYLRIHSATECAVVAGFDANTQVCAGTEGKAGACHGDSGGAPLPVRRRDARARAVGNHELRAAVVGQARPVLDGDAGRLQLGAGVRRLHPLSGRRAARRRPGAGYRALRPRPAAAVGELPGRAQEASRGQAVREPRVQAPARTAPEAREPQGRAPRLQALPRAAHEANPHLRLHRPRLFLKSAPN